MSRRLGRRRFVAISAAAAGLSLAPTALAQAAAGPALQRWRGAALGAQASIMLHHPDGKAARALIAACVAEIRRLEKSFSLFREDSAISRLNREGVLDAPPLELVRLLSDCRRFSRLTDGAFDVTVQPLWHLYAEHYSRPEADPSGPSPAALSHARGLVGYGAVDSDPARIAFARPGMAITLNGIAQGYITDRVAAVLRAGGIESVLLDLGEVRGFGTHPSGRPWLVGLRDASTPDLIADAVELSDQAVATSAPAATRFDESDHHHHLFDPKTGRGAQHANAVSVFAPDAITADALSTAFCIMPENRVRDIVAGVEGISARITNRDGEIVSYPV